LSNKLSRIYIGSICNRDLEVFDKIKKFCKKNYNISIINLLKKDSNTFNPKFFKKQIRRYPISFIIVKLYSEKKNQEIYKTIREITPNIPLLNSLEAVEMCEKRSDTFKFMEQRMKKLTIPRTYYSLDEAYKACCNGSKIIIKLDTHNIPNLPKNDRIIGIAEDSSKFEDIIKSYEENKLFLQEYLETNTDIIYKIYVIDRWTVSITSHDRLQDIDKLTPLELIHIRVPIDKYLKRRILRIGRKIGMPIFGIDYILSKDGIPYIIDINDFPSFRSIPEAVSLISDYIYNMVKMQQQLVRITARAKG
jgi:glutathione synthase/RimK-type ligase-like ATP-grasp enzyme